MRSNKIHELSSTAHSVSTVSFTFTLTFYTVSYIIIEPEQYKNAKKKAFKLN